MILIETAEQLKDGFKGVLKPNEVLTTLYDCKIGVATEGVKGYTPTNYKTKTDNYNEAKQIVDQANFLIDPSLSGLAIARIVASTF